MRKLRDRDKGSRKAKQPGIFPGALSGPRILFVLRSFQLGGAERQVALLANHFSALGSYRVGVLSLKGQGRVSSLLEDEVDVGTLNPDGKGRVGRLVAMSRFLLRLRLFRADILLPFTDWPNKLIGAL